MYLTSADLKSKGVLLNKIDKVVEQQKLGGLWKLITNYRR
jgi:hypothetical protein